MKKNNYTAWLYLLPAILFIGVFLVYPLIDVLIYSLRENYSSLTNASTGVGFANFGYVLGDTLFIDALRNTLILVFITVPFSTVLALAISVGLASIKPLRKAFQTIYFLPYVTNTIAVGMVFLILFDQNDITVGFVNGITGVFGAEPVDFIDGPYWAKMLTLSIYTVWTVLPFKILVLTTALASVKQDYYNAAKLDGTSRWRTFYRITLPMISPSLFYLIITGFIGAFKAYGDAVALFGQDLKLAEMNTIVGYVYETFHKNSMPSYASAAAIILFLIVLLITAINLLVSKKKVHY
ncbi:MAG: sugar ABC transporter permease [Clostridia bacterium]|nr:sugar ABC transporter permease [Clostridia bacterium]